MYNFNEVTQWVQYDFNEAVYEYIIFVNCDV